MILHVTYLTSRGVGTTYINRTQRALESHLFFSTMDPLRAFEDILENVDTWPTYIISDLFVTDPNTISVKHVAAFMYRKSYSLFYCIIVLNIYYVSCAMRDWYSTWDNAAHEARYYSMA